LLPAGRLAAVVSLPTRSRRQLVLSAIGHQGKRPAPAIVDLTSFMSTMPPRSGPADSRVVAETPRPLSLVCFFAFPSPRDSSRAKRNAGQTRIEKPRIAPRTPSHPAPTQDVARETGSRRTRRPHRPRNNNRLTRARIGAGRPICLAALPPLCRHHVGRAGMAGHHGRRDPGPEVPVLFF
jgi:hypothetical protein